VFVELDQIHTLPAARAVHHKDKTMKNKDRVSDFLQNTTKLLCKNLH
jgi:hypothetical protein